MDLNDGGAAGDGGQGAAASAADLIPGAGGDGGSGGPQNGQQGGQGAGDAADGQAGDGAGGGVDPDWYQSLSAEPGEGDEPSLRDWAKAAGVKDMNALAKIARDNQRALRESGRIKVPGDGASAEEVASFRKAIGVPDDAKGYKLPELKDADGNPVAMNSAKLEAIAGIAHKHGIPAGALEATLQEIADSDAQEFAAAENDIQRRAEAHAKAWGTEAASKTAAVGRALEALGVTRDEALAIRAAITPERALDIFAKLGSGIGEDTMVTGGVQRFGLSGAEARARYNEKLSDPQWSAKAVVPGTPENAEYMRLNDAMGAEADRKSREPA